MFVDNREKARVSMPQGSIPPSVRETYGPQNLSAAEPFAGGFINFGDWTGIPLDERLTRDDRIRSQQNLYRRVLRTLEPTEGRRAVEVGCGLGLGCALALREFGFAEVTGVDIHPQQLERARQATTGAPGVTPERLTLVRGAAEDIPLPNASFDRVYSVEAAQHFRDLAAFARQAHRVLEPGGRLTVTSFFAADDAPATAASLARLLDSYAEGLDVAHSIGGFEAALSAAGFRDVTTDSIGDAVWTGLDRYLEGTGARESWPRNFLRAYSSGLLDYHVVTAVA
ncbi:MULTISPECIES: class I SAM-dependent methyltransferase [Streptomycetaceae]|nr:MULTISPECIES: class I SAM-dependent methyltransferase [Streptomycetaceae]CCB78329.1 putative methyltransferase [Streptantibioticus cattleyicolor NRRL 8057 = DSM 46488]